MTLFSPKNDEKQSARSNRQSQTDEREKLRAKWLLRLAVVAVSGLVIILIFALQWRHWPEARVVSIAGLGLMVAGAAWLSGALTGFLFGIPHAREAVTPRRVERKKDSDGEAPDEDEEDNRYKPSTSLEQIADWLTKIIVGVGLTQLNNIPGKLDALGAYIAGGMGADPANKPFALAVVIYFSVSGFLFGFLWSRLYMLRAFAEAELLKRIAEIAEMKTQYDFDNEAMNLVSRQLTPDEAAVGRDALAQAIAKASVTTRDAIFEKAKEARKATEARDEMQRRATEVLRALISQDAEDLDHESHAQLGYILQDLGKPEDSVKELSRAIEIRDRRGKSGWSYYDLRRALGRINLDKDRPSKPEVREAILADLRRAKRDPKVQEDLVKKKDDIRNWLKKNDLDDSSLEQP